jgi:hypothetical protein
MRVLHDNILIEPLIEKDALEKSLETHTYDRIVSNIGIVVGIGENLHCELKINDKILFSPSAVTIVNKTQVICAYKAVIAIDE